MTEKFLIIDVNSSCINAFVIEEASKPRLPENVFRVLVKDLPEPEENETFFDAALHLMSREMDLNAFSNAAILLPSGLFFFRNTELPFKTKTKVRQVLPLELRATFPMENEICLTDFFILNPPFTMGLNPVFSASIKESEIQHYYDSLMKQGLKPAIIAPGGLAMAACFLRMQKDGNHFIFLDITEDDITATLIINKQPALARTFALDDMTPETLKGEVNRMILGFEQRTGLTLPFDIFVSGPGDGVASHEEIFQSLNNARISRETLLTMLSPNREIQGLFNFCRGRYGSDSFFESHAKNILSGSILAILVFVLFMANIYGQIHDLEKEKSQKKQTIASIFTQTFPEKKAGNNDPFLLMQSLVKQSTQSRGTLNSNDPAQSHKGIEAMKIIFELSKQIPGSTDVELSTLMLENKRMALTGSTENFNTVDQLKGFIEKSPLFKKVEISSAAAGKNIGRVDFKFIVEL